MAIFTQGVYKINFDQIDYVNAIIRYNSKNRIEKLSDASGKTISLPENVRTCGELLTHYTGADREITLQYVTANSSSLFEVFPKVVATAEQMALASQYRTRASKYLAVIVNNTTEHKYGMPRVLEPLPALTLMTREEALMLVLQHKCSGALEIPELQTFLFEYKSTCFYVNYGESCHIGHMNWMALDIDDGFVFKEPDGSSAMVDTIAKKLQTFFMVWKESNYSGLLFPAGMELNLDIAPSVTGTVASASASASASAEEDKHPAFMILSGKRVEVDEKFVDDGVVVSLENPKAKLSAGIVTPDIGTGMRPRSGTPSSQLGIFSWLTPSKRHEASSALDEKMNIAIETTSSSIDFKDIDPRIESSGYWTDLYPNGTDISFPLSCAKEILDKLRSHPLVTRVNREWTEVGEELNEQIMGSPGKWN